MRKTTVFFLFIAFLFTCEAASAYEYENNAWGSSLDQAKQGLEARSKIPTPLIGDTGFTYSDTVLGQLCTVNMYFTPKSQQLAYITITWDNTSIGESMKDVLIQAHGEPFSYGNLKERDFIGQYRWGQTSGEHITLDYRYSQTILCYYSGDFYPKYLDEKGVDSEKILNQF